ncbi:MAG: hypothetical protein ABSF84_13655 [Acidimicrobiales bacterium]|jgi:hypothetical protein
MTPTRRDPADRPRPRPARALIAAAVLAGLGAVLAACGSSPPAAVTTAAIVKPPTETVLSCSYAPGNKVPDGEPQGEQPPFAAFSPDQAGQTALQHIKGHGGTGLVYGYQIPSGTHLYAGPDSSSAPVGTIPVGRSVFLFDPVLWTTSSGQHWLVTFMACGGSSPYWVSVDQVKQADMDSYIEISKSIDALLVAQDYTKTGEASSLPVIVSSSDHFAWKDPSVPFTPARSEYVGFGV